VRGKPAVILRSPHGDDKPRRGLLSVPASKARGAAALSVTSVALLLVLAPAAVAQDIAVTASLAGTDDWARVGAYVPVTLKVANNTDRPVTEVEVRAGGPVDTRVEYFLAVGHVGETVVPVFYVGGDLALEVVFRDAGCGEMARVRPEPLEVRAHADTGAMVQPEAYALFGSATSEAGDRLRTWLALAVFAGAVLVLVAVAGRRATVAAVVGLVVLAVGAVLLVPHVGGAGRVRLREWTLLDRRTGREVADEEHIVLLESGNRSGVAFPLPGDPGPGRFAPLFASPDAVFRPFGVLCLGADGSARFVVRQGRCLLHALQQRPAAEDAVAALAPGDGRLPVLAARPDVVATLRAKGARATDAGGRSQTIDAWAVAWKTSPDADLAWAGRSLAWWDAHRRTGDGPVLVYWMRDPAPKPPPGIDACERMPAMVVCTE